MESALAKAVTDAARLVTAVAEAGSAATSVAETGTGSRLPQTRVPPTDPPRVPQTTVPPTVPPRLAVAGAVVPVVGPGVPAGGVGVPAAGLRVPAAGPRVPAAPVPSVVAREALPLVRGLEGSLGHPGLCQEFSRFLRENPRMDNNKSQDPATKMKMEVG